MAITVDWDSPHKTVVFIAVQGNWTWPEMHAAMEQTNALIDSVDGTVHCIVDFTPSGAMPTANPLQHGRRAAADRHPRIGHVVKVGVPSFMKALLTALERLGMIRHKTVFVSSVDEARALLAGELTTAR